MVRGCCALYRYIVQYRKVLFRLDGLIDQTKSIPSSQESAIYGSRRRKSNPTKKRPDYQKAYWMISLLAQPYSALSCGALLCRCVLLVACRASESCACHTASQPARIHTSHSSVLAQTTHPSPHHHATQATCSLALHVHWTASSNPRSMTASLCSGTSTAQYPRTHAHSVPQG